MQVKGGENRGAERFRFKKLKKEVITWKNGQNKHKILTIYSQNISGGRTKIQSMNEIFSKSEFHVIALLLCWFSVEISDYKEHQLYNMSTG